MTDLKKKTYISLPNGIARNRALARAAARSGPLQPADIYEELKDAPPSVAKWFAEVALSQHLRTLKDHEQTSLREMLAGVYATGFPVHDKEAVAKALLAGLGFPVKPKKVFLSLLSGLYPPPADRQERRRTQNRYSTYAAALENAYNARIAPRDFLDRLAKQAGGLDALATVERKLRRSQKTAKARVHKISRPVAAVPVEKGAPKAKAPHPKPTRDPSKNVKLTVAATPKVARNVLLQQGYLLVVLKAVKPAGTLRLIASERIPERTSNFVSMLNECVRTYGC